MLPSFWVDAHVHKELPRYPPTPAHLQLRLVSTGEHDDNDVSDLFDTGNGATGRRCVFEGWVRSKGCAGGAQLVVGSSCCCVGVGVGVGMDVRAGVGVRAQRAALCRSLMQRHDAPCCRISCLCYVHCRAMLQRRLSVNCL